MQVVEKLRLIFIENIRREAERLHLDYKDVADRAGLSRSGIYKIMQGLREPGFDNIERIAKALEVPPQSLLIEPGKSAEIAPHAALAIVAKALESRPKPEVSDPRIARFLSAIESSPALLDSLETLIEVATAANEEQPRPVRRKRPL